MMLPARTASMMILSAENPPPSDEAICCANADKNSTRWGVPDAIAEISASNVNDVCISIISAVSGADSTAANAEAISSTSAGEGADAFETGSGVRVSVGVGAGAGVVAADVGAGAGAGAGARRRDDTVVCSHGCLQLIADAAPVFVLCPSGQSIHDDLLGVPCFPASHRVHP